MWVYLGRKPSIDVEKVRELKEGGMGATAIARELGIDRTSVYRVLGWVSVKRVLNIFTPCTLSTTRWFIFLSC